MRGIFSPKESQNTLYEKFSKLFCNNNNRVHIANNMNGITYTQISLAEDNLAKIAKKAKSEIVFMPHNSSDECVLMNFGPYTSVLDWRLTSSKVLDEANAQLAKIKHAKH